MQALEAMKTVGHGFPAMFDLAGATNSSVTIETRSFTPKHDFHRENDDLSKSTAG